MQLSARHDTSGQIGSPHSFYDRVNRFVEAFAEALTRMPARMQAQKVDFGRRFSGDPPRQGTSTRGM